MPQNTQIYLQQLSNATDEFTELADQLRQEIVGGLLHCHDRTNANTSKLLEVTAFSYALIELLIEKGLISEAELNERKYGVARRLIEKLKESGMGAMLQQSEADKYGFENQVQIDCENRIHLCKAACCRLKFALSKQDVAEGMIKWELDQPYIIAQTPEGYCRHFDCGSYQCQVYHNRPIPCRAYDCRHDTRIWADFENRIVSSELETLFSNPVVEERNSL